MLMENWYRRKDAWLRARPTVCRALLRVSRALTLLVYAVYIGGMALLLAEAIAGVRPWQQLIRFVLVPAVTFLTGSALRARLNAPRPYEVLQLPPIAHKDTRGKSFPSRHVFSAAVISSALFYLHPWLGAVFGVVALLQAAGRVLLGVHWLRDVLAGLAFGWLCGLIGFWLI